MKNLVKIALLFLPVAVNAQSNIGIGTNSPDASAQLDISSANKGVLIPRVSLVSVFNSSPVSAPAEGLLVWNTNAATSGGSGKGIYYWNGSQWNGLIEATNAWRLAGNSQVDTSVNFIGSISGDGLMFRVNNLRAGGIFPFGDNLFLGKGAGQLLKYNTNTGDGERNTFLGSDAGKSEITGRYNTYVGARAGFSSNGSFGNTFIGANAGVTSTTGSNNIGIGVSAGVISGGTRNISVGNGAGAFVNGENNIAIGDDVASFIQGGKSNIFIGTSAATGNFGLFPKYESNNNVIIGDSAVFRINGATANVIIGKYAGHNSSQGNFNVFVGDSAGINNSTGNGNTFLGSKTRASLSNNITNATAIGANAYVTSSNSLVLGGVFQQNGATSMTNVGIGINNPYRRLWVRYDQKSTGIIPHINSAQVIERADSSVYFSFLGERETGFLFANPNSNEDGSIVYNSSETSRGLQFRTGGNNTRMVVTDNGNVGIGINDPNRRLWVRYNSNSTGRVPHGNSVQVLERSGGNGYLSFLGDADRETGLLFAIPSSSADASIVYNASATPQGLQFRAGSNSTKMVITSDTKIGIGTVDPQYRLHVVTNDAQNFGYRQGIMIENVATGANNTGEAAISFKNQGPDGTGNSQWMIGLNQTRNLSFAYGADFAGGSITKMYIDSTGNVGIGSTAPGEKLDVNGNIKLSGSVMKNSTGSTDLLPICYGNISSAGSVTNGSGNFSATRAALGQYEITINGESHNNTSYVTVITPLSSLARMSSAASTSGKLLIRIFDSSGSQSDTAFYFVVYKP